MRLCRVAHATFEQPRYAFIEGDDVCPVNEREWFDGLAMPRSAYSIPLAEVRLLAPVTPSKIVCVGRNYREHAAELGNKMPEEPLLFLKAPSAVISDGDTIELPRESGRVEHEGELGVVIGHRARHISANEDPLSYVLGYTCVNDVTARDLQRKDVQFTRAKSFDTFCPVGPVIVRAIDPLDAEVTTRLNGDIKQRARTSTMAFSVPFLIRYIAEIMTLYPGDLIATGTPAGVSPMKHGDIVEIEIEGIGVLRNYVN
ncbi:MAG: fumarylacetoacetate hydrolase family protein [Pyrinomonadaceae bacterium]|nr:fumarylacetoacetate hydrolase family protein [Pyrinomonadaceae bacterium]